MIPNAISARDAAAKIGISEQRVRTILRNGNLDGRQIGKQWITTDAAVTAYLESGGMLPPEDRSRAEGPLPSL